MRNNDSVTVPATFYDEIGGYETQSAYFVVADADAVHVRAKAEGWKIVAAIKDEDYGGRGFSWLGERLSSGMPQSTTFPYR